MKKNQMLILFIIIYSLFVETFEEIKVLNLITFSDKEQYIAIVDSTSFKIPASYVLDNPEKYLYIYPRNQDDSDNPNKAAFKIYFKKFSDTDKNINYLESDYSTLDLNSGLFIRIGDLKYDKASIFINAYETCNFWLYYKYTSSPDFPEYDFYTNFQLNQFILPRNSAISINSKINIKYNAYLMILSKTSLRNIEIKLSYNENDYTYQNGVFLYPNAYSAFFDTNEFTTNLLNTEVEIKNKNNKDEIILLGYISLITNQIFPNPIYNGFQLYLEGNSGTLSFLQNSGNSKYEQYFTTQTYSKTIKMIFYNSQNVEEKSHAITEYNSMFHYNLDTNGRLKFSFVGTPSRSSLYFQYLDYNKLEIAQKLAQPLVTGSPKTIYLPAKKSMYHFLPIERESISLHYYLRSRCQQNITASFKTCINYPDECSFTDKIDEKEIIPFINNIGLWYSKPTNRSELQLIYVYCEKECSYDILMTYDDDPLFLFPENNYTKFISISGEDIYSLPVFEYLSNFEQINIDLNVMSGKADLILKNGRDGNEIERSDYTLDKFGNKQAYIISKEKFTTASYYKKDIYAIVKGEKNTFYNLMYGSGSSQTKLLDNNRVIIESLTVPTKNKESEVTKTFTFTNNENKIFISITTKTCKFNAVIGSVNKQAKNYNFEVTTKGNIDVKINLINDGIICNEGFQEEVTIFSYTESNTNILLSENTLINNTFSVNQITFTYLFKPSETENVDNSFNIDIEKTSTDELSLTYTLERKSFNITTPKDLSCSRTYSIISTKNVYFNNKLINEYCNSLDQNEICYLTMTFGQKSPSFSLYLNKNGHKIVRQITDKTLVTSANSKSVQYYFIDLNQNYKTEVIINSYEQDLEVAHVLNSGTKLDESNLPSQFLSSSNYFKITQEAKKDCGIYCRLYIAVRVPEDSNKKELFTTFSITYLYKDTDKAVTPINLPLNYYSQYSFSDSGLKEINYYVNKVVANTQIAIELVVIKQNEDDNSVITASISGIDKTEPLTSNTRILNAVVKNSLSINIKYSGDIEPAYKLKISTVGIVTTSPIIPILSSFSEKCKSKTCFYTVDISQSIEENYAYFYVPELEDAVIYIRKLEKINKDSTSDSSKYDVSSDNEIKRTNWYQYKLGEKGYSLFIKVSKTSEIESSLSTSFYSKPNKITLNYGDKRIFNIGQSSTIESILFIINKKETSANQKYKINIHAIRGNGIFKHNDEKYFIGLNSTYKEDMSIIINEDKISNLELTATNEKDGAADKQDFVFTIEYIINTDFEFVNQIENNKINSFKIMNSIKLDDLYFYMKAENSNKIYNDVSMNLKIYSNTSTYDIKSYIGDESFINKITDIKNENSKGEIRTFITGGPSKGNLTFARLTIPSSEFTYTQNKDQYVYIVFSPNGEKSEKVKIDLYPYNMTNNSPLARNQLFVQKIPSKTTDYQLLLVKSDIDYSQEVKIIIIRPLSKKYEYGIGISNKIENSKIRSVKEGLVRNELDVYGKSVISLNPSDSRYILYNIYSKETEEKEDLLIFSYQNQFSTEQSIYGGVSEVNFNVSGTKNNIIMKITEIPSKYKSKTTYIFNAYEKSKVNDININEKHKPLYLFFSEIKPDYTMYKILESDEYKSKTYKESNFDYVGEFYFTCIAVIEDNEREEYLGFYSNLIIEGTKKEEEEGGGLLDYMKNHVFATILIIIILLFFIGIMINVCRNERKSKGSGKNGAVNIEVNGELLKDV